MRDRPKSNPALILNVGFLAVILLLGAVIAIGLTRMAGISHNLEQVVNTHNLQLELISLIKNAVRDRSILLYALTVTQDPFAQDDQLMAIRAKGGDYLAARLGLLDSALEPEERALLEAQHARSVRTTGLHDRVIELALGGRVDEARHLLVEEVIPSQNHAMELMDRFAEMQQKQSLTAVERTSEAYRYASRLMLTLGLMVTLLGGLVAFFVKGRIARQVSDLADAGRQLGESELRERTIREHILDAVVTIDETGLIESCNAATTRIFGYSRSELVGNNIRMLMPEPYRACHDEYLSRHHGDPKGGLVGCDQELGGLRREGARFPLQLGVTEVRLQGKRLYIGVIRDITDQKQAEEILLRDHVELELRVEQRTAELKEANERLRAALVERAQIQEHLAHMANHDALTRLPNRKLFSEQLKLAVAHARRRNLLVGVLFLDLDGFKHVNDCLGHEVGDRVLRDVCSRLKEAVRAEDLVARIGGDEFAIVIGGLPDITPAIAISEKLVRAVALPFDVEGECCRLGVSIGISICPDDGEDAESLLRCADDAMYRVKKLGKSNFAFYNPSVASDRSSAG